jgi:uncharacterized membrane protein YdbT with pleckstrin-like domain
MSYFETVRQPHEELLFDGRIHWLIYLPGAVLFVLGLIFTIFVSGAGVLLIFAAAVQGLQAWYKWWTTEIIVTNRRVLVKRHWIARNTQEMNLTKIESVDVRQSVFQRLMGAGYILVRGTGGSWEPIGPVDRPVQLRRAIEVG